MTDATPLPTRSSRERGTYYLSADRLAAWRKAHTIAYEQGRSDGAARDLMRRALLLAAEQQLVRQGRS
jgi:hypothetical protein